jgi:hypothetical protein
MCVPLTVNDFLYRAEAVSAYAAAVVDEPVSSSTATRACRRPQLNSLR